MLTSLLVSALLSSQISHALSNIHLFSFTLHHPPSTIHHPPSIIHHPPSIFHLPLSTNQLYPPAHFSDSAYCSNISAFNPSSIPSSHLIKSIHPIHPTVTITPQLPWIFVYAPVYRSTAIPGHQSVHSRPTESVHNICATTHSCTRSTAPAYLLSEALTLLPTFTKISHSSARPWENFPSWLTALVPQPFLSPLRSIPQSMKETFTETTLTHCSDHSEPPVR